MSKYKDVVGVNEWEIDPQIRELVFLFNKCGFKTDSSCQGHREYEGVRIIFDESVSDTGIFELAESLFAHSSYFGEFSLWVRKSWDSVGIAYIAKSWQYTLSDCCSEDKVDIISDVCAKLRLVYCL